MRQIARIGLIGSTFKFESYNQPTGTSAGNAFDWRTNNAVASLINGKFTYPLLAFANFPAIWHCGAFWSPGFMGQAMKVFLVIPLRAYERLLSASDSSHPTYLLLRNGVLEKRGNATDCVKILTSSSSANFILDFAAQTDPQVRASIRHVATPGDDIVFNLANLLGLPPKTFRRLRKPHVAAPDQLAVYG